MYRIESCEKCKGEHGCDALIQRAGPKGWVAHVTLLDHQRKSGYWRVRMPVHVAVCGCCHAPLLVTEEAKPDDA